jgi:hypothetical protein
VSSLKKNISLTISIQIEISIRVRHRKWILITRIYALRILLICKNKFFKKIFILINFLLAITSNHNFNFLIIFINIKHVNPVKKIKNLKITYSISPFKSKKKGYELNKISNEFSWLNWFSINFPCTYYLKILTNV